MIHPKFVSLFLLVINLVAAHGGHGTESASEEELKNMPYAQRHMVSEHHIDSFDPRSFFFLHDLNRDGFWDKEEIEAIYGVHHVYSQKKSADDIEHAKKAETIVRHILGSMDRNKDLKISPEEFEAKGVNSLPNFDNLGAEGHHYDVESEFFLHHEEQFHSTPETQTEDSYIHAEDIEHFAQHEKIEHEELVKEASFEGVSVEELAEAQDQAEQAALKFEEEQNARAAEEEKPVERKPARPDPVEKIRNARQANADHDEWDGFKVPVDKSRKTLRYKDKFRKSWGDF